MANKDASRQAAKSSGGLFTRPIDAALVAILNSVAQEKGMTGLIGTLMLVLRWLVIGVCTLSFGLVLVGVGLVGLWTKEVPRPDPIAVNSKNEVFPVQTIGRMGPTGAAEFATRMAPEMLSLPFYRPERVQNSLRPKFTERGYESYVDAMKPRLEEMGRVRLNMETQALGGGEIVGKPKRTPDGTLVYYVIRVPVAVALTDGTGVKPGAGSRHDLFVVVAEVPRSVSVDGYQIMRFTYDKQ